MEEHFSRFLDVFKKIEIDLPFVEALTQMPNYAKFLKDIMSKKRKCRILAASPFLEPLGILNSRRLYVTQELALT